MIPLEIDLGDFGDSLRQVVGALVTSKETPELEKYLLIRIKNGLDVSLSVLEDTWGKLPDDTKTADLLFQQIMIFLTAGIEVGHIMKDMSVSPTIGKEEEFSKDFENTAREYVRDGKLFKHVEETVEILEKYISPFVIWWIETTFVESVTDPRIKLFDEAVDE